MVGRGGERRVAAAEFFVSLMTTALEADEIVVSVRMPKAQPGERHAYLHFSRRVGDFAIVAVAVTLLLEGNRVKQLRLGVGGVEGKPLALTELAARARGQAADAAWAVALAAAARDAVEPTENPRVPAVYRRELVEVLTRRALLKVLQE
jgi:carbon-monoxide dehydrogenase medium subunit